MSGIVLDPEGKPLPEAIVYSTGAAHKRENIKTGSDGRFSLTNPGPVIEFAHATFEPQFFLVRPETESITITLKKRANELVVRECGAIPKGARRVGWGKYGMHFDVPRKTTKIIGGKPDVDYVLFWIHPKNGGETLQLWFGNNVTDGLPDPKLLASSSSFEGKYIAGTDGGVFGSETNGKLTDGKIWRQATFIESMARYTSSPENAVLFNQIIDSACYAFDPEYNK